METGSREYFRFLFFKFFNTRFEVFFYNKIISGEPCKVGSLVEKIISKDTEACRAGSLGEWKSCEIENGESV